MADVSLSERVRLLKSVEEQLSSGAPGAFESAARIAQAAMHWPEATSEFLDAARTVIDAPVNELRSRFARLIDLSEQAQRAGSTGQSRILVVEDGDVDAHCIHRALAAECREIVRARTGAEALRLLDSGPVSMVVLDIMLPDVDARNLLLRLRASPQTAEVPILVVSCIQGIREREECVSLGADVYLTKPVDSALLATTATALLLRSGDRERRSRRDPLTGLPDRGFLAEAWGREMARARRLGRRPSISIIDLDHFKQVNDEHGHAIGDETLRAASRAIRDSLRESDLLVRWGGEEFVVFLPDTSGEGARCAIEHALESVRALRIRGSGDREFTVSFSAGVTTVLEGQSLEEAVSTADRLLYAAKHAGRSRVIAEWEVIAAPRKTVLLAEDDPVTATLVSNRLGHEGLEVLRAGDGAAALELARRHPVHLVVLDVDMPVMDGFEVLATLRKDPSYDRVPIAMLTSMGSEQDVVRGLDLGADDYILKPFSSAELQARVRRLLKRVP